jgi:hypothetical protein
MKLERVQDIEPLDNDEISKGLKILSPYKTKI